MPKCRECGAIVEPELKESVTRALLRHYWRDHRSFEDKNGGSFCRHERQDGAQDCPDCGVSAAVAAMHRADQEGSA